MLASDQAAGPAVQNCHGTAQVGVAGLHHRFRSTGDPQLREDVTLETWLRTVLLDTTSRRAISVLVRPLATRSSTSRSRSVSSGNGCTAVGARPAAKNGAQQLRSAGEVELAEE